ncbi:hypothetical protein ACFOEE_13520 [Pseudoalteromonas fenneropenaei]|uniref:DUF2968 domain-containing protein n=1 Tax=Pseudoalteromonas fenneropenaei TaxID=1737459 RepID=A0ABV7CLY6_9GAMM
MTFQRTAAILAISLALPLLAQAKAKSDNIDMEQMSRDVGIFENVLESSLRHDTGKSVKQINGYYLQNQGVVFELSVRSSSKTWFSAFKHSNDVTNFIQVDPENFEVISEQFSEFGEGFAEASREAYRAALDAVREKAEQVREVAEQEREVQRDIRDLEREKRDLSFNQRLQEKDQQAELQNRIKELEAKITQLQSQQKALNGEQQSIRKRLEEQKAMQEKQQQAAQQAIQSTLDKVLSQSLCDYGAGLKSLPKDQYISFVIRGVIDDKRVVQVYSKEDVQDCVSGKLKAEQLLAKAQNYQF